MSRPMAPASLLTLALLSGCQRQTLLQNLDQGQANEVIAALQQRGIAADKRNQGKAGFSVSVAPERFGSAVALLQRQGLPSPPQLEIADLFPADVLLQSPRAERIRLNSALEQRLGRMLRDLDHVLSAHVQLSYAPDGPAPGSAATPPHAAVLLVSDGQGDAQTMIRDVQRLLKNSLNDLDYANVSVVIATRPEPMTEPAR